MADLVVKSLQGGLCTKSPTSMLDDQCAYALNVEWYKSKCGERRNGNDAIDFAGSGIASCDRVVWVFRHLPTSSYADAQLWALGITDPSTPVLVYKDTTWHTVSMSDAPTIDGTAEYQISAASLHGKLFIAYNAGSVDRLHVWDGSSLRRTGLAEPAAPTAADTGGAGAINDIRYYRVRYTVQSGGTTLRRSEPSDSLTHNANATAAVTVTKPAGISEGETHWELEASEDNVLFYRIATTVVGTTTYVDSTADASNYTSGTLSEDIGDYSLIPSVRYLAVDEDRLIAASSFESETLASRVMWTPVYADPGVGNDERLALDTDPYKDLNKLDGGGITALHVNGDVFAFKLGHIYQGLRTSERSNAYDFICLTKARGAIPGTVVSALDNGGLPSIFALDPHVGPIRIGGASGGIETCGADLIELWEFYRQGAVAWPGTTQLAVYVPEKKQVQFWVPGSSLCLVLHAQYMRSTDEGFRGGWAMWTITQAPYSVCNFATNIDANTGRTLNLRPFIGTQSESGLLLMTDTSDTDNGTTYIASIYTRQFLLGNFLHDAEVKDLVIYGVARDGAHLVVQVYGNKADDGMIGDTTTAVDFSPHTNEGVVFFSNAYGIRHMDGMGLSEVKSIWIGMSDLADSDTTQWAIESIAMRVETGNRA